MLRAGFFIQKKKRTKALKQGDTAAEQAHPEVEIPGGTQQPLIPYTIAEEHNQALCILLLNEDVPGPQLPPS